MALEFWVKNNLGVDTEIADLGTVLTPSQEIDLYTIVDVNEVNQSAAIGNLFTLEAANTVDFLDGSGGTAISPDEVRMLYISQDELDAIGGSGITESQHRALDQLVHLIAENAYTEYTYSGNQVTDEIMWTDSGKTIKIRETNFTYTGNKVNTEAIKQYNAVGALLETLTKTYTFTGNKVTSINEVLT